MIYTTLNRIRSHDPCELGWKKLLKHLGKKKPDDEPLAFTTILESNGLDDTLWCLRSVPEENNRWRLLAVRFARTVQHLMDDERSIAALDVAERHARGGASDEELETAREAAWAAAQAAAEASAWAAAEASAWEPAWDAAWEAVREAAWAAAKAAAWEAAKDAAWDAAMDAAMSKMEKIFLETLEMEAPQCQTKSLVWPSFGLN